MDGLQAWCSAVCLSALGCAALRLLAPKNSIGKVFSLLLCTFFLCCMVSPLLAVRGRWKLDVDGLPDAVVSDLLADTVNEQLQVQVRETVTAVVEEALRNRGVTAEEIAVITDISEEGGIYIQHITITVDKQTIPVAAVVREVLERQLQTTVEVKGR